MRPLSERDLETLDNLESATNHGIEENWREGLVRVMDFGGTNGSHHGATLCKLAKRGFAEQGEQGLIAI
jgi:hypothetical protein